MNRITAAFVVLIPTVSCGSIRNTSDSSVKDIVRCSQMSGDNAIIYIGEDVAPNQDTYVVYRRCPANLPPDQVTSNCSGGSEIGKLALRTEYVPKLEQQVSDLSRRAEILSAIVTGRNEQCDYPASNLWQEAKAPFDDVGGGDGGPSPDMRFVAVQRRDFEMQETEVTRGQWISVMGGYPEEYSTWNDCSVNGATVFEDNHPVSCVTWNQANSFAHRMTESGDGYTYRLPSEEEWAHAAGFIEGAIYGWCDAQSTQRVGALRSHNGLYDMVGNVSEWTTTSTGTYFPKKVFRGGSYHATGSICSSRHTFDYSPNHSTSSLGFRLLRFRSR